MSLEIARFILGPLENNAYLLTDSESRQAVLVDAPIGSQHIARYLTENQIVLTGIWITHAHFDHFAGLGRLIQAIPQSVRVALHSADLQLWQEGGEAQKFGVQLQLLAQPDLLLEHNQSLMVGTHVFQVLHTPGHSPGHVTFYSAEIPAAFCGDVIFERSIGRTDLPGGNTQVLLQSIRSQIFTLPHSTRLFSGHGRETTVANEQNCNPFLL